MKFLRVECRGPWLIKGACGQSLISEGLSGRTSLVSELRAKLNQACDGDISTVEGLRCRGAAAESVDTDDPMAQVAEDEVAASDNAARRIAHRRNRYFLNPVSYTHLTLPTKA